MPRGSFRFGPPGPGQFARLWVRLRAGLPQNTYPRAGIWPLVYARAGLLCSDPLFFDLGRIHTQTTRNVGCDVGCVLVVIRVNNPY